LGLFDGGDHFLDQAASRGVPFTHCAFPPKGLVYWCFLTDAELEFTEQGLKNPMQIWLNCAMNSG
jgi:hypothetical protein